MTTDTFSDSRLPPPSWRSPRRWWKHILIGTCLASAIGAVAFLCSGLTAKDTGPQLTHRVSRGDLVVTVIEQGLLESAENNKIKSKLNGRNTVLWVIESGTMVKPGDELVRLDSLSLEEQVDERTKYAHWSRSAAERSAANLNRSKLAVDEYEQGRYVAQLMELEKELFVAEAALRSAQSILKHARMMADSKYISELEVEEKDFAVQQAKLNVGVKRTEIDVLKRFTRAEQMQTLQGDLASIGATHKANTERAMADASRRDRALDQIQHCVIRAERSGMVIHPNAASWEMAPIAEGATVHKDQVLLLMPDLSQMQVKVGVHESVVDRMKVGLAVNVTLADQTVRGQVSSVASITKPAGWWTGNEVRYDMMIDLPDVPGLRPGMSAEAEMIVAEYKDVLRVPVAAIVESNEGPACWTRRGPSTERRSLVLGDSNGVHTIVLEGLDEGDEVVLNPFALQEARLAASARDEDSIDDPNDADDAKVQGKLTTDKPARSAKETPKPGEKPKPGKKPKPGEKPK